MFFKKKKNYSIARCPLCKWETDKPCYVCNGLGFVVIEHNKPQSHFEKKYGWSYFSKLKVEEQEQFIKDQMAIGIQEYD